MLLTRPPILVPPRPAAAPPRRPPPRGRLPLRRSPRPLVPWWRRRVDAVAAHGLQFGPDGRARFASSGKALFASSADPCCCSPCPSPGPSTANDTTSAYTVSGYAAMTALGCPPPGDTTGNPCAASTEPLWNGVVTHTGLLNNWSSGVATNPGKNPPQGPWWRIAGVELYEAVIGIASDAAFECPFWFVAIFACYRNDFAYNGPARLIWVGTKFDGGTAAGVYAFNNFVESDVAGPANVPTCGGNHPASLTVS